MRVGSLSVMAGLVPAIHAGPLRRTIALAPEAFLTHPLLTSTWMPATSAGMTAPCQSDVAL